MSNYTREDLINLCLAGSVAQEKWTNRDSSSAQMQLGQNLFLLMAGCDFRITEIKPNVIHIEFEYEGFNYKEGGYYPDETPLDREFGYIPTKSALDKADGEDWY